MSRPLRLLLIEDNESDAALSVRLLEKEGYQVHWQRVETLEGLRNALTLHTWDVIISDYVLPSMDAPAALAVFVETALDIPFIVVSGTVGEDIAVNMMKAGAQDYLLKDSLVRLGPAVTRELVDAGIRHERRLAIEALRLQTEELLARNSELTRFNKAAVNRELRMVELKKEVDALLERLGEPPRYGGKSGPGQSPAE